MEGRLTSLTDTSSSSFKSGSLAGTVVAKSVFLAGEGVTAGVAFLLDALGVDFAALVGAGFAAFLVTPETPSVTADVFSERRVETMAKEVCLKADVSNRGRQR